MPDPSLVLVVSNDLSLAAAKTSRHLCRALNRLGRGAICRDTRLIRWSIAEVEKASAGRREAYEAGVVAKWQKFVHDYGIGTVISLDLNWLLSTRLYLEDDKVRQIHSFWFDDLRSCLQSSAMFPFAPHSPLEIINHAKVSHHCYGRGQAEEMRMLGVRRVSPSPLAAPAEYLEAKEPCTEMRKLAFVGNPGLASPPSRQAIAAMEMGESLAALRRLAREDILRDLRAEKLTASWLEQCPQVFDLLSAATERRLVEPYTAAISLLAEMGRDFSEAFEFLNRGGHILDAAVLVKFVNRYDRPALVHRLWRRGWLDVFGTPDQWAPYGITAQPTVPFSQLPSVYRRYPAHLNAANCARDATANEKLFEIAACGRASLNLNSPDVAACYGKDEIFLAETEEQLEAEAEKILRDSTAAFAMGEKGRRRTANEHLWEHRLGKALA